MRIRRVTVMIHRISLCRQNRQNQSWKEGGRMHKISRIGCAISKTTKLYAPIILVLPNFIAGKRNQGEHFSRTNRKQSICGLIYMTYFQRQNHFLRWCPILMRDLYTYTIIYRPYRTNGMSVDVQSLLWYSVYQGRKLCQAHISPQWRKYVQAAFHCCAGQRECHTGSICFSMITLLYVVARACEIVCYIQDL